MLKLNITYDELEKLSLKKLKSNQKKVYFILTLFFFVTLGYPFSSVMDSVITFAFSLILGAAVLITLSLIAKAGLKNDFRQIKKIKENPYEAVVLKGSFLSDYTSLFSFYSSKIVKVKSVKGRKIGKYKYARYYSIKKMKAKNEIKGKLLFTKNKAFFVD